MLTESKTCWNIKKQEKQRWKTQKISNTSKNIQNMQKIWMKTLPQRKNLKNSNITQKYEKCLKHKKYWKYRLGEGRLGKPLATRSTRFPIRVQTP